jgi:undecaprenyl diphosphate synthase
MLDQLHETRNAEGHTRPARTKGRFGLIPDGSRRWSDVPLSPRYAGFANEIARGAPLENPRPQVDIEDMSIHGFDTAHARESASHREVPESDSVEIDERILSEGVTLLVVGDRRSRSLTDTPLELLALHDRTHARADVLVHYGWQWDLRASSSSEPACRSLRAPPPADPAPPAAVRLDLIVRWSGRRRLSGLLPSQSADADVYVADALWIDTQSRGFIEALCWFASQAQPSRA